MESGRWVVILYLAFGCAIVYINCYYKIKIGERNVVTCGTLVASVYSSVALVISLACNPNLITPILLKERRYIIYTSYPRMERDFGS